MVHYITPGKETNKNKKGKTYLQLSLYSEPVQQTDEGCQYQDPNLQSLQDNMEQENHLIEILLLSKVDTVEQGPIPSRMKTL